MNMKPSIYAQVLQQSGDDFNAVRDSRRAMPFYFDVDLSTARSGATSAIFNIAGNSFYIDANPNDGTAFVEFQDTANDAAPAPLYVSPGSIFNVPFTQIRLQNSAQAGKKIRIVYGVDIDFQPGSISQVAFTGSVVTRTDAPIATSANLSGGMAALAVDTIITPAANVNGAIILRADSVANNVSGMTFSSFIGRTSAPAALTDGRCVARAQVTAFMAGAFMEACVVENFRLPPGEGFYFISGAVLANAYRSANYILL